MIFWFTCFEQLGHARQTARNIAGFAGLAWDTCQHVTGMHFLSVIDRQNCIHGEEVTGFQAVRQGDDFTFFVTQRDPWFQIRTAGLLTEIHDFLRCDTGRFVEHFAKRNTFNEVAVMRNAAALSDDWNRVRIPIDQLHAFFHRAAFFD